MSSEYTNTCFLGHLCSYRILSLYTTEWKQTCSIWRR